MFGSTRGVGRAGWGKLCNEEACNLYSSSNINLWARSSQGARQDGAMQHI